nr:hypothetical protein [Tanacetum cinerariifolium]
MAQPTTRNHAHKGNHKQYAQMTHHNPQKHMVHAAVLTQSKPVSITVVRLDSADVPKIKVTRPRHAKPIVTKTKSPIRRHLTHSSSPNVSNSPLRVTAVKDSVVNVAQDSSLESKIQSSMIGAVASTAVGSVLKTKLGLDGMNVPMYGGGTA